MVTMITAYIYRLSISKELKALVQTHYLLLWGRGKGRGRQGGGDKGQGMAKAEDEEGEEGSVGGRESENEQERRGEGQKDATCYYACFTDDVEWGSQ